MEHFYRVYEKNGRMRNPGKDAQRALQRDKTLAESLKITDQQLMQYYQYANELYERRNYEDASDIFFFLTQMNPYVQAFWVALANSESMKGRFEEAFAAFQMGIVMNPLDPEGYLALAKCCVNYNEKEAAMDYLNLMESTCESSNALDAALAYKKSLE